jgi:hypothetical protein
MYSQKQLCLYRFDKNVLLLRPKLHVGPVAQSL